MKLPNTISIAGTDEVELYLAAMSSHDGSKPWQVIVTPVRIVCANTQHLALRQARSKFTIKHTASAKSKIAQARTALRLVWNYSDAFQKEADKLINETLTDGQFDELISELWPYDPNDEGKRAENNRLRRTIALHQIFADANTNHAIRGTAWAGLQAVTEYLDHHAPASTPDVRAHRVLTSATIAEKKQMAYELLAA